MNPRSRPSPPLGPDADPDAELARHAKALGLPARVKTLRFLVGRLEALLGGIAASART